jgi:hypothetical protein
MRRELHGFFLWAKFFVNARRHHDSGQYRPSACSSCVMWQTNSYMRHNDVIDDVDRRNSQNRGVRDERAAEALTLFM